MVQAVQTSASRTGKRYREMFILRAFPGLGCRGRCGAYRASASYAIKLRHHEGNFDGISADRR
jgi:hypothetical protein